MNKPVYLGLSVLELRKILMYEFWYDCVKSMVKKQNCVTWIQADSLYIKTDDIYKDVAEDVETRFDTSNRELDRLLPNGKKR